MEKVQPKQFHDDSCDAYTPCAPCIRTKIQEHIAHISDMFVKAITENKEKRQNKPFPFDLATYEMYPETRPFSNWKKHTNFKVESVDGVSHDVNFNDTVSAAQA